MALRKKDVLVQHPMTRSRPCVQRLVEQAAADTGVLAIKQTSTAPAAIAHHRCPHRSCDGGMQVLALVEIKARFDEQANILGTQAGEVRRPRRLCMVGLKTHCKLM